MLRENEMQKLTVIFLCFLPVFGLVLSSQEAHTYDAVLHGKAILNWTFPFSLAIDTHLIVVIRTNKESSMDVLRFDEGKLILSSNYTGRVWLPFDGFKEGVVTLKIDPVHTMDAGEYYCIVQAQCATMCHLKVRAPWSSVRKSNISMSGEEYALSCESEGFPLANLTWTDAWGNDLSEQAKVTAHTTSGQLLHKTSQLNITLSSSSSNYTCTLTDDRGHAQTATFVFPGLKELRQRYMLILPVLLAGVTVVLIVRRLLS